MRSRITIFTTEQRSAQTHSQKASVSGYYTCIIFARRIVAHVCREVEDRLQCIANLQSTFRQQPRILRCACILFVARARSRSAINELELRNNSNNKTIFACVLNYYALQRQHLLQYVAEILAKRWFHFGKIIFTQLREIAFQSLQSIVALYTISLIERNMS